MDRSPPPEEEDAESRLRRVLRCKLHAMYRRGPVEPTFKHLLTPPSSTPPPSSRSKQRQTPRMYRQTAQRQLQNQQKSNTPGSDQPPAFPRDKLYKKVGGEMRRYVETYLASNPPTAPLRSDRKRGRARADLDDAAMRASFTLRECKRYEQEPLVKAALACDAAYAPPTGPPNAIEPVNIPVRRKILEQTAHKLQQEERMELQWRAKAADRLRQLERERAADVERRKTPKLSPTHATTNTSSASSPKSSDKNETPEQRSRRKKEESQRLKEDTRQRKEQAARLEAEKLRAAASQERFRERERQREQTRRREELERRTRLDRERAEAERIKREKETPKQALRRLYEPIFRTLWDMEFGILHGTNPFRIVIDAKNCAAMGVPDYAEIIKKPMNLAYIQEKVQNSSYDSLQQFFGDVELMISNALLYNSDPANPYHVAAKEMRKKFKKMAKRVVVSLKEQQAKQKEQQQQQQQGKKG